MRQAATVDRDEVHAFITLSLLEGVGVRTLLAVQNSDFSYRETLAMRGDRAEVRDASSRMAAMSDRTAEMGARMVSMLEPEYPPSLFDLEYPPAVIFCKGNFAALDGNTAAVVGTRVSSRYGDRIAAALGAALAGGGVCVVSGLARGIDSAAHRGALKAGGFTCAVLGTGMDITYPAGHASLQRTIAEQGLVITESPPGDRPTRGSFPKRNRIIAALSRVTFVVEAGIRSGALLTADLALELNRGVAAIPGPIDSPQSAGTNHLLRDGAQIVATIADALTLAGAEYRANTATRPVNAAEKAVLGALGERQLTSEQIVDSCGLPVPECLAAISSLEIDGLVESLLTGEVRRTNSGARAPAELLLQ